MGEEKDTAPPRGFQASAEGTEGSRHCQGEHAALASGLGPASSFPPAFGPAETHVTFLLRALNLSCSKGPL